MSSIDDLPVPDYLGRLRLDGKGFVVIGAGQGMGRQTAHALAQAGAAKVVCVDVDPVRAQEIADEIGVGVPWSGDCTKRDEVARLAADAEAALGRIDGFVDIVGVAAWCAVMDIDDATWDHQLDLNLRHAYLAAQELGRRMVASGGGSMVFIASVSGLFGAPMHAGYGAAKAGLMALVKSLAVELGPLGIRANAVAPGSIATPRMIAAMDDAGKERSAKDAPLGRLGNVDDIAGAALFLSSDLASFVSGQTLVVDGAAIVKFPYGNTL
jgi:NAD(P)-dependent dehydrogenase (short-subunit alcohol dehydrogenase family)